MAHDKHPYAPTLDKNDKVVVERGPVDVEIDEVVRVQQLFDVGAEGWRDMLGDINSAKVAGANVPTWSSFQDGISAYSFSATAMKEVWISFHINHDYKDGTALYPHMHWSTGGTNTGVVRWGFEYVYAKGHDQAAFPSSTTIYVEQAASGTANQHMIAEVSDGDAIPGTNIETDGLILIRAFRDGAHANDTCTDAAFGFYVDLHYQASHYATPNKAPSFF